MIKCPVSEDSILFVIIDDEEFTEDERRALIKAIATVNDEGYTEDELELFDDASLADYAYDLFYCEMGGGE